MSDTAKNVGEVNLGSGGASAPSGSGSGSRSGSSASGRGTGSGSASGSAARVSSPPIQSLDFILDVPLKVTVELGRAKLPIREILQLAQGSVVELTKFAGEPLEILINDKLIARGGVVVVNEKFGVRLTDIISPVERIEQLR